MPVSNSDKTKQLKTDYEFVFRTAEGERVLNDIIKSAHVLEPTFTPDPYETAFREGERNVALRILALLNYTPKDLGVKVKEIINE
jgi:hypothetical protein